MKSMKRLGIGGVFAFFAAIMFALAIAPGTAKADDDDTWKQIDGNTLGISGLKKGDEVTIYQVVRTEFNSAQAVRHEFTTDALDAALNLSDWESYKNDPRNPDDPENPDTEAIQRAANEIAKVVTSDGGNPNYEARTLNAKSGSVEFGESNKQTVPSGEYLVVVNTLDVSRVFRNTIVNVMPVDNKTTNDYVHTKVNVVMKSTNLADDGVKKFVRNDDEGATPKDNCYDQLDSSMTAYFTIKTVVPDYGVVEEESNDRIFLFEDYLPNCFTRCSDDEIVVTADEDTLQKDIDYTLTDTRDKDGLKTQIGLTATGLNEHKRKAFTISYTANMVPNGDSDKNAPVFSKAYNSKVTLKFSSGSVDGAAIDPSVKTTTASLFLTVYGLKFQKMGRSEDGTTTKPLKNANFSVTNKRTGKVVATGTTDKSGDIAWNGALANNTEYTLTETKAPAGYAPIEPILIDTGQQGLKPDANYIGKMIDLKRIIDLSNAAQTNLPITGGPGTIALTAVGVCLIAGAAVIIGRSRKKHE